MIDYSNLKSDLYNVVRQTIPTTLSQFIIFDRQSAPEPVKPYCTIRLTNLEQVHRKNLGLIDNTGIQDIRVTYSINLEFRVIGSNAVSIGQFFNFSFSKDSVLDMFESIGLFYYDKSIVRDVPQLLSTGWEERSIQTISFYIVDVQQDDVGWIEQVELEQTYVDSDGNTLIQETDTLSVVSP